VHPAQPRVQSEWCIGDHEISVVLVILAKCLSVCVYPADPISGFERTVVLLLLTLRDGFLTVMHSRVHCVCHSYSGDNAQARDCTCERFP
jgi:hypothetical protein